MDLTDEELESLRIVEQSDLPASWIAQGILESVEGYPSKQQKEPEETDTTPEMEPENESERSIFAC